MDPPQPVPSPTTTAAAASSAANPNSQPGAKLRLMCSYGGQIVPRPHDNALCYAGGETRIVAVDRRTTAGSISALTAYLSKTLLGGRSFTLKYQLPNHDLDSLVSVATDEDLANMIDEYDRLGLSSSSARLRFFLFPVGKADSTSGEYDARAEAWFFDSLRSARIAVGEKRSSGSSSGGESEGKCGGAVDSGPGPGPESIVLETNSSFGSTGSAVSVSTLPAVRAGGGEEAGLAPVQDLKVNLPVMGSIGSDSSVTSSNFQSPNVVYLDSLNQSDPKDSSVSSNFIESNSSDISSRMDLRKPIYAYGYPLSQPVDQLQQQASSLQPPLPKPQLQPTVQPYLQPQLQDFHAASPYVTQYYPGAVTTAHFPTTYQPYLHQPQQQTTYALNNPSPVYVMPVGQAQTHDMSMQRNMTGATAIPPSRPQLHPSPPMMVTSGIYDRFIPAQPTPELAAKAYRTAPMASQPVTVPSDESKFVAVTQRSRPAQTQRVPVSSAVEGANYGGAAEYDDPLHAQIYKTQPTAPAMPSQFQPMTSAAPGILSDNLAQLRLDNTKQ